MSTQRQIQKPPEPKPPGHKGPQNSRRAAERNFLSWARVVSKHVVNPSKIPNMTSPMSSLSSSTSHHELAPISHYRPLRRGISEFGVVYDVTQSGVNLDDFYTFLADLMPLETRLGTKHHIENGHKLIEIVCNSEETCTLLIQSPLKVGEHVLTPVRTLDQEAEIVYLKLSDLPYLPLLHLEQGLRQLLSAYGQVLDVLLYTEKRGFFLGSGMAVLNITNYNHQSGVFQTLKHNLSFFDQKQFHATWKSMPKYCRYCHSDDHLRAKCSSRTVPSCWNCGDPGHFASQRPLDKQSNGRKTAKLGDHHRSPHPQPETTILTDTQFEELAVAANVQAEAEHVGPPAGNQQYPSPFPSNLSEFSMFSELSNTTRFAPIQEESEIADMEGVEESPVEPLPPATTDILNSTNILVTTPDHPSRRSSLSTPTIRPLVTTPKIRPASTATKRITRSDTRKDQQADPSSSPPEKDNLPHH